ncbi:hypothetical protein [Nonomuraea sp. NPDC003709]|uniref:hypothetical protein n=1 Tax=Nonomuraea sp. NPDC003709 TaxID=3154450 RepID=UPI0033B8441C
MRGGRAVGAELEEPAQRDQPAELVHPRGFAWGQVDAGQQVFGVQTAVEAGDVLADLTDEYAG